VLSEAAFTQLTKPALNNYAYGVMVLQDDGDTIIRHDGGIAGFATELEMHMNDGFGLIAMANGGLDGAVVRFAIQSVKAALRDQPLPAAPVAPDPAQIANAGDYAGTFTSASHSLEIVASGNHLAVQANGATIALLRLQGDTFRAQSAALGPSWFVFTRAGGKVTELIRGADWYTSGAYTGPRQFDTPPEYAAYTGRYVNHNPEEGGVRIFVRKGHLYLATGFGAGQELLPAAPLPSVQHSPITTPSASPSTPSSKDTPSVSITPASPCTASNRRKRII
jgi:D-alanyl-D-alanine carboxypeptidase